MVQGTNWNNYSANQIIELKNKGVEVPKEVLTKAQDEIGVDKKTADEVTSVSDDNNGVDYSETEVNEAKKMREELEAEGTSLKEMVQKFTEASKEASALIENSGKELLNLVKVVEASEMESKQLSNQAVDEQQMVIEITKQTEEEIQTKEGELDFLNEKIEDGSATESEQEKAETLGEDIKTISSESGDKIKAKAEITENLNNGVSSIAAKLSGISEKTKKLRENAKDGAELGTETFDMSKKLYDKGMKKRKIAMALGALAGGVGGFFAGKAVGKSIQNNIEQNYLKNNNSGVLSNNIKYSSPETAKKMAIAGTASSIGGAGLGAGVGMALGSLFGKDQIKTGGLGMVAGQELNTRSQFGEGVANAVEGKISTTTETNNVADVDVTNLENTVTDGTSQVAEAPAADVEKPVVTTPANENPAQTGESDNPDDPNKKKPVV